MDCAISEYPLTLMLHFKTSEIINDMTKINIKLEKIIPFWGIFHMRELFTRYMGFRY